MSDRIDISSKVRTVLLEKWDPIGVADEPAAQDEYDAYVSRIVTLVRRRAPIAEIASSLLRIETELMRLPGNRQRADRVARALVALDQPSLRTRN